MGLRKKLTQKAILWQNVGVSPARPDPRVQMRGIKLFQTKRRKIVSGSGQAKAKKKSAKKAVVGKSTPVPALNEQLEDNDNERLEEFIIGDVRCFAGEQRVPIRPITLLVGANSTGKTTFLGGYRVLHHLTSSEFLQNDLSRGRILSFNDEPFSMGAFQDIVNRGAMKRRAPAFQLGAKLPFTSHVYEDSASGTSRIVKDVAGKMEVIYSFEEVGSSPLVRKASVIFPSGEKIDVVLGEHQFDGLHHITLIDPLTGKRVTAGGLVQVITTDDISMAFSYLGREGRIREKNMQDWKEGRKNIIDFLDRQIFSEKKTGMLRRHMSFYNESIEYSLSPIRAKPKRTYDPVSDEYNPEGDHVPMFLAQLSRTSKKEWESLRKRLVDFGKESGMFSDFKVKGLGKHVSNPFQIHVKAAGVMSNLLDVGYGVGQVYPLLVQIMRATQRAEQATFLLQEPEVHLHPQAQAALTSFFVRSVKDDGHAFIIETHGDAIIDRVRICVSNGLIPPEDVVILYFETQPRGNVKIHPIRMDKMANLLDAPKGYRKFFMDEGNLLLGFKKLPKGGSRVRNR